MGILGTVGNFAGGLNWIRIALVCGIAVSIFGLGYMYANQKNAEKAAEQARVTAEEIAELSRQHADEMRTLALVAANKEREFTEDMDEIEIHRDALIEQITNAELTKPVPEVRVEACLEGDEDVQVVVANPFSDSFRMLWNQTSRNLRPSGSEGTDSE